MIAHLKSRFLFGGSSAEDVELVNQIFLDSYGHRVNRLGTERAAVGLGSFYLESEEQGSWVETFAGDLGILNLSIPYLPAGAVVPFEGESGESFTYVVNYYHPQGYEPTSARVYVDGVAYEMEMTMGTAGNATYRHTQTLQDAGEHSYYFEFSFPDGMARLPEGGLVYSGPSVGGGSNVHNRIAMQGPSGPAGVNSYQAFLPLISAPLATCSQW